MDTTRPPVTKPRGLASPEPLAWCPSLDPYTDFKGDSDTRSSGLPLAHARLAVESKDLCKSRPKLHLSRSSGSVGGGRKLLRCELLVALMLSSYLLGPYTWPEAWGKLALSSSLLTGDSSYAFPLVPVREGKYLLHSQSSDTATTIPSAACTEFPTRHTTPAGKKTARGWSQHAGLREGTSGAGRRRCSRAWCRVAPSQGTSVAQECGAVSWQVWLSWLGVVKGGQFNSQPGHIPGLRAQSPVGVVQEAADQCLALTSMSLSLPL